METINDTNFELATFPFFLPGKGNVLSVILKGSFEFDSGRSALAVEQAPILYGDEFFDPENGGSVKFEADLVPFKPKADVILVGTARAPAGEPVPFFDASLQVGDLKKEIRVIGDRKWKHSDSLTRSYEPSPPELISEMPIVYEKAFGGIDIETGGYCKENYLGRGYIAEKSKKTIIDALLPNLEDPANLIISRKDHPQPVGCGFYHRSCEPRMSFMGTYDEAWRKERSPLPPENFNPAFYNGAHPDLQVEGYLKGDEEVVLANFTANTAEASFQLPGIYPVCRALKEEEEDIPMNLDTLCMIPDEKRFYQVWRGVVPIKELDDWEIKRLIIGLKGE